MTGSGFSWVRPRVVVAAVLVAAAAGSCAGRSGQSDDDAQGGDASSGASGEAGASGSAGDSGRAGQGGDTSVGGGGTGGSSGSEAGTGPIGGEGGTSPCSSDPNEPGGAAGENAGSAGGSSGPCMNGALAIEDGDGEPECFCPVGYAGPHCEYSLRDCRQDDPPCDPETSATGCTDCRRARVDVGPARSCTIDEGGHVACWGGNEYLLYGGECEDPTPVPECPVELMSTGRESCALGRSGGMSCWGLCTADCEGDELLSPLTGRYVALSVGIGLACALDSNWELVCTDSPRRPLEGQFHGVVVGHGFACALDLERRPHCASYWLSGHSDIVAAPSTQFRELSAGNEHVCGIRLDGTAECWGENAAGQASPPSGRFRQLASGKGHTCGLREDDTLECWGQGPAAVAPSGAFVDVASGDTHSCGLRLDGKVTCWGGDDYFQLHPPPELAVEMERSSRFDVGGDSMFPDELIDCTRTGTTHGCELDAEGHLDCWGSEIEGVPEGAFVDVSVGHGTACALRDDGAVACWGNILVEPDPQTTYRDVSAGFSLACAVRTTGEIDCWEWEGPMDDWHFVVSPPPPPVGSFTDVAVSANPAFEGDPYAYNHAHACALATDGSVRCWGHGYEGMNGSFVRVSAGHDYDCALGADGAAVCMNATSTVPIDGEYTDIGVGVRFYGLRTNGTLVTAAPWNGRLEDVSDEAFVELSVAGDFACARRADGAIRCFESRTR